MVKLYTKRGDRGQTSLYDGSSLGKEDFTFEVLGDLDELASFIGLLCSPIVPKGLGLELAETNAPSELESWTIFMREIQDKLLDIGSNIATTKKRNKVPTISEQDVLKLESFIDFYQEKCPELKDFILTGSGTTDSISHICRAVSRRVERHLWKLHTEVRYLDEEKWLFIYINRLSDYFFALSRYLVHSNGLTETKRGATS